MSCSFRIQYLRNHENHAHRPTEYIPISSSDFLLIQPSKNNGWLLASGWRLVAKTKFGSPTDRMSSALITSRRKTIRLPGVGEGCCLRLYHQSSNSEKNLLFQVQDASVTSPIMVKFLSLPRHPQLLSTMPSWNACERFGEIWKIRSGEKSD